MTINDRLAIDGDARDDYNAQLDAEEADARESDIADDTWRDYNAPDVDVDFDDDDDFDLDFEDDDEELYDDHGDYGQFDHYDGE